MAARRLLSRFIWGGAGLLEKHLGLARNSSCHSSQGCDGSEVGSAVHCTCLEPKIPKGNALRIPRVPACRVSVKAMNKFHPVTPIVADAEGTRLSEPWLWREALVLALVFV